MSATPYQSRKKRALVVVVCGPQRYCAGEGLAIFRLRVGIAWHGDD